MIARELVATAKIADGGELACYRHDRDYFICIGNTELMSTRVRGSEEMLAEFAIERRGAEHVRRVLVGGLGMGFSLARVLELVGPDVEVAVVELVPEVVQWHEQYFGEFAGHPLRDPRTQLIQGDVVDHLRDCTSIYDVILLDVDNGPDALVRPGNRSVYSQRGLARTRTALRADGVLGIWSASEDGRFENRLQQTGFDVSRRWVRARRTKGPRRIIWTAQRLS
ncbi:MAG: spermidine synthase [bacterium]|nr:spermidine synthase [bacterium]